MQLNPQTLKSLLSMNDDQLAAVVKALAAEAGINAKALSLDADRMRELRGALGSVTNEDLSGLSKLYDDFRRGK